MLLFVSKSPSAITAAALMHFHSQHTQYKHNCCWPCFVHPQSVVAVCWPVCLTQKLLQNCIQQTSQTPVTWKASFASAFKKQNPLFSIQKHTCVLLVMACLVLPCPMLWGPLLGPGMLCFDLPKTPNVPAFIRAQKAMHGDQSACTHYQCETPWLRFES